VFCSLKREALMINWILLPRITRTF